MQNNLNVLESTSNKIHHKIDLLEKLRKEIINYTNNFREFKLLKSDIIERILDNENDFLQLDVILKSVTNQNFIQRETINDLLNKTENLENHLKNSEKDISKYNTENDELKEKIKFLTISNEERDVFIYDLLSKVNFLENVIRDYQKRIYISRYDKMFNYRSPFKNEDVIKKVYDKLVPKEYKFLQYPYYWLNLKNSYNLSGKILDEENLSKENNKKEIIKAFIKERPASIDPGLTKRFKKEKHQNYCDNKNKKIDDFVEDKVEGMFLNKIHNKISNDKLLNINDHSIENVNRNNNLSERVPITNDSFVVENEEEFKNSNGNFTTKNSLKNKPNAEKNKSSLEKIRANMVSDLLLKIFSSANISRTLKRKFGENFEIKLTDKHVDPKFIYMIEKEVNVLIDIEIQREDFITQRKEMDHIRKRSLGKGSTFRAISPNPESELISKARESFNNFTKKSSRFFDPKLQYGGESCVPSTTRTKSNEKTNFIMNNNTHKKKDSKSILSL